MRKLLVLVIVVLSIITAKAQKLGGFGYISIGTSFITSTQIQNRLQEDALFGSGFSFKQQGTHIGIRVMGAIDRLLVGGGGYRNTFTGSTDVGEANLKVLGRFFNVGYFLISQPKTKIYAFLGFGGRGGSLVITRANNASNKGISFGTDQKVLMSEEVSQNGVGYELGIGVNKFILNKNREGNNGLMVGAVAGINLFPSTKWEFKANGTNVANMGNMSSLYFGITVGGGGFSD